MRYLSSSVKQLLMVTLLLLAVATTVTTARPAAAQTAPGACEWPVAGNLITDGLFTSGNAALWGQNNPYTPTNKVETITGHPCGYTTALNSGQVDAIINHNQGADILFSGWVKKTEPNSLTEFTLRTVGFTSGVGYYDYGQVVYSPSPAIGSWGFVQACIPGAYDNASYHLFIYQFRIDNTFWSGLSAVPWQCSPGTAIPTATPSPAGVTATPTGIIGTAVAATATPSGVVGTPVSVTATPAGIVGTAVAVTATPSSGINNPPMPGVTVTPYRLPTRIPREPITPFEQLVYGPDGKDTILADLPPSVADLPALPAAIQGSGELTDMPLPEIDGAAVGTQVLGLTRGITKLVFEHPLWTPIRWIGYTFLSLSLLGLLIYK